MSYCLSANHNPKLRCVICTGVTLFAVMLHLHCTALSQSESSNILKKIVVTNEKILPNFTFPKARASLREFSNVTHSVNS